jgi:hypothetical protein
MHLMNGCCAGHVCSKDLVNVITGSWIAGTRRRLGQTSDVRRPKMSETSEFPGGPAGFTFPPWCIRWKAIVRTPFGEHHDTAHHLE